MPFPVRNARAGDLVVDEVEFLQVGHGLEVRQPRVSYLGAANPEVLQFGQPLEMHQPRVSNLGAKLGLVKSLRYSSPVSVTDELSPRWVIAAASFLAK